MRVWTTALLLAVAAFGYAQDEALLATERGLLAGTIEPLDSTPSGGRQVQQLYLLADPARVVKDLRALEPRLEGYNPVLDLLAPADRRLLEAVLAWNPSLASFRDTSRGLYPSKYPVTAAVQLDDVPLVALLLSSGARAENDETDPEGDPLSLPVPENSWTFARSDAMRAFLKQAGAQDTLEASGPAYSRDSRVRIREKPVDGTTLGYLALGDAVALSKVTAAATTIDGVTAPWYKVTAGKLSGWVWGGLLSRRR